MLSIGLDDFYCGFVFNSLLFSAAVTDEMKSVLVMEGETVTLNSETILQTDDKIRWMFGVKCTVIAETKGGTKSTFTCHGPDGRFKDRLDVDYENGFMTIADLRFEDGGRYEEEIIRSKSSGTTLNLNRHSKCDSTKIINKSSISSTDPQDHRTVNLIGESLNLIYPLG